MASGLILNPHNLLRAAPLVSSTCTLWFAFDQDLVLNVFLHPDHRPRSNEILPSYFNVLFRRGVVRVVGLLALSMAGGGYNILKDRRSGVGAGLQSSLSWYVAGTVLAASHLLYVPVIAPKVLAIMEDSSKGSSTDDLEGWLTIHRVRTWTVDFAAWACFAVGLGLA